MVSDSGRSVGGNGGLRVEQARHVNLVRQGVAVAALRRELKRVAQAAGNLIGGVGRRVVGLDVDGAEQIDAMYAVIVGKIEARVLRGLPGRNQIALLGQFRAEAEAVVAAEPLLMPQTGGEVAVESAAGIALNGENAAACRTKPRSQLRQARPNVAVSVGRSDGSARIAAQTARPAESAAIPVPGRIELAGLFARKILLLEAQAFAEFLRER